MLDFEKSLIGSIIRHGYQAFVKANIQSKFLSEQTNKVIEYIGEHYQKFEREPTFEVLKFKTDVDFTDTPDEVSAYWGQEIKKKYLFKYGKDTIEEASKILPVDPQGAINHLFSSILNLDEDAQDFSTWDIFKKDSMIGAVDSVGKKTGIPTFHPTLTHRVGGWEPQDLIIIAGRPSSGKSFVLLQNCLAAWEAKYKVMLVTTEMSRKAMQLRLLSLAFKMSYGRLKNNNLASMHREFIIQKLDEIERNNMVELFTIMGDTMDVTIENIEKHVRIAKPKLVAIDGAYLVKSSEMKSKDRYQRIAEIFDAFKGMAKRNNVAVIVTSQINRPPSKKGKGEENKYGIERLAFSDNIGMVADYAFLLHREPEDRDAKVLEVEIGKLRESANYDDFFINWDLDDHDFRELTKEEVEKRRTMVTVSSKKDVSKPDEVKKPTPIATKGLSTQNKERKKRSGESEEE